MGYPLTSSFVVIRVGDGFRIIAFFKERMKASPIQCIRLFCMKCKFDNEWEVANCQNDSCFLHPVRPNQGLKGKQPDQYDMDELSQQVLDNLNFKGLKEMLNERTV